MGRVMSDAEIRRRKKAQGHISQTTGALGLASLGAFAASKVPAAKVLTKTPRLRRLAAGPVMTKINPKKAEGAALGLSTAGAGIGGAGSFNFASYTGAESRKRKPVSKELGMDMGYFGDEGRQGVIEKAWQPVASNFDSEASRKKRGKAYETGAAAAGGAAATVAGIEGRKAVKAAKKVSAPEMTVVGRDASGKPTISTAKANIHRAVKIGDLKTVGRHGGKAAAGLAAVGGAAATHSALKRKRKGSWQSYGKRDTTSAFGIDHDTEWTAP